MVDEEIPLPQLAAELRKLTGRDVTYRRLWHTAASGRLPGVERRNGRVHVTRGRLPEIAEVLGLTTPPRAAA